MNKIVVILNPAARGDKARAFMDRIRKLSTRAIVRITSAPGDARFLAERAVAEGFQTIVAAGGDGTINAVVNGIAGSDAVLGLLPIGTMNVFAAELKLPSNNLAKCWSVIESGHVRRVDLPRANKHYFVQLGGVGFDAQIVKETSWDFRKNFGPLSYLVSATQIAARKPPRLLVKADGRDWEGSFILVGNGRYYGGPFEMFRHAKIDDGKIDVLIFKNLGYLDIVRYLSGIVLGTHASLPDVEYFQTRRMTVSSSEDVPVEVDGEVIGGLPVSFGVSAKKLRVLAPPQR